jgi:RNA polymerase sigma-70 factor (ECF subfamily)
MTSSSKHGDEQTMISAILNGDCALFHELIRPHERKVYALAYALLRDEVAAEEVAIGVFLAALSNLHGLDRRKPFDAWLNSLTIAAACSRSQTKVS